MRLKRRAGVWLVTAATLAAVLIEVRPARACGCSEKPAALLAPALEAVAVNSVFVVQEGSLPAGSQGVRAILSNERGEQLQLETVAQHPGVPCNGLALVRPSQPLTPGAMYSFAPDQWATPTPFTAQAAAPAIANPPTIQVELIERPTQQIQGQYSTAPEVSQWFQVNVAFAGPGELSVFASASDASVPEQEVHGAFARVAAGEPPVDPRGCSGPLCAPCVLCVPRIYESFPCVEVRAYAEDGSLAGRATQCFASDDDPAPTGGASASDEGCSVQSGTGTGGLSAALAAVFAVAAFRLRRGRALRPDSIRRESSGPDP